MMHCIFGYNVEYKRNGDSRKKRLKMDPVIITMVTVFIALLGLTSFAYIKLGKPRN